MAAEVIPGKGIFDLLDIAAIVLRACPEARFVFAGSGSAALTNRFRQAIVAAGLHERVVVLGQVKQMDEFHAALDAFVLPSRLREGLPRTLIEAAACGVPAVAWARRPGRGGSASCTGTPVRDPISGCRGCAIAC